MTITKDDNHPQECQARIADAEAVRRLPIALLVALAVAAGVPDAASASVASPCRSEGATVAANGSVRVYAHGSHGLDLWTCAYRSRRWSPISLGQRGSVKERRGVVDVTVAGGFVGLRGLDPGCSGGECVGPIVQVYDPLRRRQSPDVKGDSYVLRSDGTFAVVTPLDPAGNATVELHGARGTTVAATGAIDPETLALAGRNVYWTQDGLPQTAALAMPMVSAAATGPAITAPARAAIGESISVSATGLKAGGVYRLSFEPPVGSASRKTVCERTLDRPYRSGGEGRTYVFRGRVPTTLRCGPRGGNSTVRTVKVKAGHYRWVVGRKTGHGTWDKAYSIAVAHVTVTRSSD